MGKSASVNMNEIGKVRDMRESDRDEGIVTEVKGGEGRNMHFTHAYNHIGATKRDKHRQTQRDNGMGKGKGTGTRGTDPASWIAPLDPRWER